jgi:hypothetical protein
MAKWGERGMEEAPENGKVLSHFAHAKGMNKWMMFIKYGWDIKTIKTTSGELHIFIWYFGHEHIKQWIHILRNHKQGSYYMEWYT